MNMYQFITSFSWAALAFIVVGLFAYLVLSGRLKWIQCDSLVGKIGLQVSTSLGVKDLSADEILAFEGFVYRDLQNIERGARLAYVLLFLEKELLDAQYQDNILKIELTEKGRGLHNTIIAECEKKLMISPQAEIQWRTGDKKVLVNTGESQIAKQSHV